MQESLGVRSTKTPAQKIQMGGTTPSSLRYNVTWSYVESLNGSEANDPQDSPFKYSANNLEEVHAIDGAGEESKQVRFEMKAQALKSFSINQLCYFRCHSH